MREIPLNRSLFVFWEDVVFLESALLSILGGGPWVGLVRRHIAG